MEGFDLMEGAMYYKWVKKIVSKKEGEKFASGAGYQIIATNGNSAVVAFKIIDDGKVMPSHLIDCTAEEDRKLSGK